MRVWLRPWPPLRAGSFLASQHQTIGGVVARVEQSLCTACLVCVRRCPYGVPRINENDVSEINEALCQGCGICAWEYTAKAIQLAHYSDDQLMAHIDGYLSERRWPYDHGKSETHR